jgi:hypothetical protein
MKTEQIFKNEKLTQRKCVNSIIRFYSLATANELVEGMKWYNEANSYAKELASRFDFTIQKIAGIIAVFSPQAGWTENKRYAVSFLINPKNRLRSLVQEIKAKKILKIKSEADIYNSLAVSGAAWKSKSFYLNILNPDIATDVTIDRHAIAICIQPTENVQALNKQHGKLTEKQYNFFQTCYIKAASDLDILPHQLQAITWIVYRRLRELREHSDSKQWQPFTTNDDNPF